MNLKITLTSQIISFMHVCSKVKDHQHGFKGQLVLPSGDLSKVQSGLSQ